MYYTKEEIDNNFAKKGDVISIDLNDYPTVDQVNETLTQNYRTLDNLKYVGNFSVELEGELNTTNYVYTIKEDLKNETYRFVIDYIDFDTKEKCHYDENICYFQLLTAHDENDNYVGYYYNMDKQLILLFYGRGFSVRQLNSNYKVDKDKIYVIESIKIYTNKDFNTKLALEVNTYSKDEINNKLSNYRNKDDLAVNNIKLPVEYKSFIITDPHFDININETAHVPFNEGAKLKGKYNDISFDITFITNKENIKLDEAQLHFHSLNDLGDNIVWDEISGAIFYINSEIGFNGISIDSIILEKTDKLVLQSELPDMSNYVSKNDIANEFYLDQSLTNFMTDEKRKEIEKN